MPVKPKIKTLTNSSVDILNAIRNSATTNYQNYVPIATPDAESIREIGNIIMSNPSLQNEFISALVNRVGRVVVTSKMFDNPLRMFKKGLLEFGETVEEIFVNIAKPFDHDPETAEQTVFKREIPDVRSAFHVMNYQKYYKVTVQNEDLKLAFLSWEGVSDLIARITDSIYSGAYYDEFQTMKYLIARHIIQGNIAPVAVAEPSADTAKSVVSTIKGVSNKMEFPNTNYNRARVLNKTEKRDQYYLINADFDAVMGVDVLASAFNMDKAEFIGNRVLIDGFGDLDIARLNLLFKDDPTYVEISQPELDALNKIPVVIVDRDWFMVFDNLNYFTENFNGAGPYWNYFYHVWKTFSVSPFAQAVMFIPATPSVTSVTLNPTEATLAVGAQLQINAVVETENFAPQSVTYTSDSEYVEVNASGLVTVLEGASGSVEITATSTFDSTKTATCTLTIE